jgi:hypothetical protein
MISEQRYKEILVNIKTYLGKFKGNPNSEELAQFYFTHVEQDKEKLYNLLNDGVYEIEVFELVREVYKNTIILMKENSKCINLYILNDVYLVLRFVYESILFMIETEFR